MNTGMYAGTVSGDLMAVASGCTFSFIAQDDSCRLSPVYIMNADSFGIKVGGGHMIPSCFCSLDA